MKSNLTACSALWTWLTTFWGLKVSVWSNRYCCSQQSFFIYMWKSAASALFISSIPFKYPFPPLLSCLSRSGWCPLLWSHALVILVQSLENVPMQNWILNAGGSYGRSISGPPQVTPFNPNEWGGSCSPCPVDWAQTPFDGFHFCLGIHDLNLSSTTKFSAGQLQSSLHDPVQSLSRQPVLVVYVHHFKMSISHVI